MQKLSQQDQQEAHNAQVLKMANEYKALQGQLRLANSLTNDAVNQMEIATANRNIADAKLEHAENLATVYESMADFHGLFSKSFGIATVLLASALGYVFYYGVAL